MEKCFEIERIAPCRVSFGALLKAAKFKLQIHYLCLEIERIAQCRVFLHYICGTVNRYKSKYTLIFFGF